ncbi:MAG TPA: DUF3857 domain-containing protein [Bacteroidales bacterium]|nr:DUF3857 domain-containing protein [Bacteroidales bacterium]
MSKIKYFIRAMVLMLIISQVTTPDLFAQYKLPFGDIKTEELSNIPYKPDPGADAVILSDIGLATLNYVNGFYVELERDVRIKIVNSNGYDYANIEIPYSINDRIYNCRASTFNLSNGVKVESKIGKKAFIYEKSSFEDKTLKFSFPDVHEGSVVEYSYIIQYRGDILYTLIPWSFQSDIPVKVSAFSLSYPEPCEYKEIISGSAGKVDVKTSKTKEMFLGERINIVSTSWIAQNMPAVEEEPYIKSRKELLTGVTFELANLNFPGSGLKEITPTYSTLTSKLLLRSDFGKIIDTDLKSLTGKIISGCTGNTEKLRKIHTYISKSILWNGINDYTASASLRSILNKQKGNSADINMLLIAMLRSINIKADPVILSTRSHGSINKDLAMIQQFNYLIARVMVDGKTYLVDATDPSRPFNILPSRCLNDAGWLVSESESQFIDLKNNENDSNKRIVNISIDGDGNIRGNIENHYSAYPASTIRALILLISEDGYTDVLSSFLKNMSVSDFRMDNLDDPYSPLSENYKINIPGGSQVAGDEILLNPYLKILAEPDPFVRDTRLFPVDFECPSVTEYELNLTIPENCSVAEMPEDILIKEGNGDEMSFELKCSVNGQTLHLNSEFKVNRTHYPVSEYARIRSFYSQMLKKQAELIVLKKNNTI